MSATGLETLKEVFHSARELQPDERSAFLDRACGSDEQLRREVEALLQSHFAADGFISDPPAQLAAEAIERADELSDVGKTVGRYELIERIGSGGMGAVYLARRADQQFEMQVAVKLIKRGMDSESVLRRFHAERQILASLEHPNIARLLDGGTTDDGLPYFVMEYIQGDRIDRYAEQHRLSLRERLALFRQVCSAVSYAHQRLVVHRDLKPSNILVTPDGVPKLLDFGIAKIIQPDDSPDMLATVTAAAVMTPDYASPEQINGAPATTLSDVYSLGALLYELLAGRPAYRLQGRSPLEMAKISTAEIEKPSAVAARSEDARGLRGDLDNIVRMAMRRESERRYRSVEQLSEDIRRHLAGRPVVARPDTMSYRAAKFVQRNKAGMVAVALLLLTLVGGIVATGSQARRASLHEQRARAEQARAERRFNDVRKLAKRVLFDYHDAIKALPGATKARELLVRDALEYLDSLAGEAHGDPALQRELAAAYEKVGDVRSALGDLAGALDSHGKAFAIRQTLVAAHPDDPQSHRDLGSSYRKIGNRLLATADAEKGSAHIEKAVEIYRRLTREHPGHPDFQLELASALGELSDALGRRGGFAEALAQLHEGLAIRERLAATDPQNHRYRDALWESYATIAYTLGNQGDDAGAIPWNQKAIATGEALLAEDPQNDQHRRGLVVSYQHTGNLLPESDKRGVLEAFRRAAALNEQIVAGDPASASNRKHLAYTHKRLADSLVDLEEHPEALVYFRKALEGYQRVAADAPADIVSRFLVATCHGGVARMQARLDQSAPALEQCRKAAVVLQEVTGDKPGHLGRAQALEYLGFAYAALADATEASPSESREHTSVAREMFKASLAIIDEARRLQGTLGANEQWAKQIAGEIAKCDAALAP